MCNSGTCEGTLCLTLTMQDSYGNGWNGNYWHWIDASGGGATDDGGSTRRRELLTHYYYNDYYYNDGGDDDGATANLGTLSYGSYGTAQLCFSGPSCMTVYVDAAGSYESEVSWTVTDSAGSTLASVGTSASQEATVC